MRTTRYYAPNAFGSYSDAATQAAACEVGKAFGEQDGAQNRTSSPESNPNGYVDADYTAYKRCYEAGWVSGAKFYHQEARTTPGKDAATASGIPLCASSQAVMRVQRAIGVPVDAAWGPRSEGALAASGKTYWSIAPCLGDRPYWDARRGALTSGDSGTPYRQYADPAVFTPPSPARYSSEDARASYGQAMKVTGESITRAFVAVGTPIVALIRDILGWVDWGATK